MPTLTELLQAIRAGDVSAVQRLLAAAPELANARDDRGDSPLLVSTYHHKPDIARVLLDRGARPSFFEASALGLDADVRRQLRERPELAGQWAHDGWTPLHLAAFFGHRQAAEALLDAGADMLAVSRNDEANVPINAAAAGRRNEVVRLLVDRGCPVDARGTDGGYTALHLAAHDGNVDLVRFLLSRGADTALRTGNGKTALDLAREEGKGEVVTLLAT